LSRFFFANSGGGFHHRGMKWILPLLLLAGICVEAEPARFYLGTYTDNSSSRGIYTGVVDTDTGKLGPLELAAPLKNPSFVALSSGGKFLYAVTETAAGSVTAFRVENDGHLTKLNDLPSGNGGCHVSVDATGRNVFVANYNGGDLASFQVNPDGSLAKRTALISFTGSGPDHSRQEKPHLHSTYLDAGNRQFYACDLGTDSIWRFLLDPASGALTPAEPASAKIPPGSGPRHLAFSPDGRFAYVNGEMALNVTAFTHDAKTGALTAIQTVPILPSEVSIRGMGSAEIFCHPNGKWLYVSNRDVAGRGRDSLTVFDIGADGKLTRRQNVPAGVKIPRGFDIDPTGQWLVVGGQSDNKITVFKISPATGELSATDQTAVVGAPVCVVFAPAKN
jgi:6-phosphogluconolactonase